MLLSFLLATLVLVASDAALEIGTVASTETGHNVGTVDQCQLEGWNARGPQWRCPPRDHGLKENVGDSRRVLRWGHPVKRISQGQVLLIDGSRLVGDIQSIHFDHVTLDDSATGIQKVPMELVMLVSLAPYGSMAERAIAEAWGRSRTGIDDYVLLNPGEPLAGKYLPSDANQVFWRRGDTKVLLRAEESITELSSTKVRGFVPSPVLRDAVIQSGRAIMALDDGNELNVASINERGKGTLACGLEFAITTPIDQRRTTWWHRVSGWIEMSGVTWLGSEGVSSYVVEDFFGQSNSGQLVSALDALARATMEFEGRQWPAYRGVVMSHRSRSTWHPPKSARFLCGRSAVIAPTGLKEQTTQGQLVFRVLTGSHAKDLKERWRSDSLSANQNGESFVVDLREASMVVLTVEPTNAASIAAAGLWQDLRYEELMQNP